MSFLSVIGDIGGMFFGDPGLGDQIQGIVGGIVGNNASNQATQAQLQALRQASGYINQGQAGALDAYNLGSDQAYNQNQASFQGISRGNAPYQQFGLQGITGIGQALGNTDLNSLNNPNYFAPAAYNAPDVRSVNPYQAPQFNAPAAYQAPQYNAPAAYSFDPSTDVQKFLNPSVNYALQALQRSAAGKGALQSGGTLEELGNYLQAQGWGQAEQAAQQNAMATFQTGLQGAQAQYGAAQQNAQNTFQYGLQGAQAQYNAGQQNAQNIFQSGLLSNQNQYNQQQQNASNAFQFGQQNALNVYNTGAQNVNNLYSRLYGIGQMGQQATGQQQQAYTNLAGQNQQSAEWLGSGLANTYTNAANQLSSLSGQVGNVQATGLGQRAGILTNAIGAGTGILGNLGNILGAFGIGQSSAGGGINPATGGTWSGSGGYGPPNPFGS